MEIISTELEGLKLIKPEIIKDARGYFMESFKLNFLNEHFPNINFIQENESKSTYGILRGLHFQRPPFDQTKLVRVVYGKVLDVAVDLRIGSPTLGQYKSFILSEENNLQLMIPKGFAHGFVVLSKECIFQYKVDEYYNKSSEDHISFDDRTLNINWIINESELKLSRKDKVQSSFENYLLGQNKFKF